MIHIFFRLTTTVLFLLVFNVYSARAGQVDTLDIYSPAMNKTIRCLVLKPDNYTVLGERYPVVYLLHGHSGNYTGWLSEAPQLLDAVDDMQMIIVCPDGGFDSWYVDSPVDSTVRYATHIATEVVAYVDYYYHTRPEAAGRAITGLSMGGHGALSLAISNPDRFGAAGSMAGGLDLQLFRRNNWDLEGVLGDPNRYWENWVRASVVNMVPQLSPGKPELIIDCGLGDFFLGPNQEMHRRLMEAKIPHDYTERAGEHNGEYWSNAVDYQILFFYKFFEKNR